MAEPDPPTTPPPAKVQVEVSGQVDGLDVTIRFEAAPWKIIPAVRNLAASGLKSARPATWDYLPDGSPICPKHGLPMKKSEQQGDSWWSHGVEGPNGEKLYCKGHPGRDSPGWGVS